MVGFLLMAVVVFTVGFFPIPTAIVVFLVMLLYALCLALYRLVSIILTGIVKITRCVFH